MVKSETDLTKREDDGTAQETNDDVGKTTEEPVPSRFVKVEDPDESELELIMGIDFPSLSVVLIG